MSRLCLYFKNDTMADRWFPGDRHPRRILRRLVRGPDPIGGVERVFLNLCEGLDRIEVPYVKNLPFDQLQPGDRVGVLGRGPHCLSGYRHPDIPIVAGIGLMTHPSEWPDLMKDYPVKVYLQHCEWAADIYRPYYGDRNVDLWPVGIHTERWTPQPAIEKDLDVLIYDKIRWRRDDPEPQEPRARQIEELLAARGLSSLTLTYGSYTPVEYQDALSRCRSMIFLCEHESQGLAYQEALSCDIPILAWENGYCLDPNYQNWEKKKVRATSVPFFDERCGEKFRDLSDVERQFDQFWQRVGQGDYAPREYILENLTLEHCSRRFLRFFEDDYVNTTAPQ